MENLTFENIPKFLMELDKKVNTIIEMLETSSTAQAKESDHVLMDMKEACEFLRKCPATLYGMTSENRIPFHKRGNKVYFFKDELMRWIENDKVMDDTSSHAISVKESFDSHLTALQASKRRKPAALVG
jgi:excisionase family DNA binding protein